MRKGNKARIQWHPGFIAAMNLEFIEQRGEMTMEREYNLNLKPLEIDLLLIKKSADLRINNEIGHFFRRYNIIEYKSPMDAVNIDVIYKCIAYAALYKAYGESADGIKADDVTISVVCWAAPRKLFRYLGGHGIMLEKRYQGIYCVDQGLLFPIQIVVAKELNKENHVWLRALSNEMKKEDYVRLACAVENLDGKVNREFAESVLQVSIKANNKTLKEDKAMSCEALRELFEPELKQSWQEGKKKGVNAMAKTMNAKGYRPEEIIDIIMQSFHVTQEEASKYLK